MLITIYGETHSVSVPNICVECGEVIGTKPCIVIQPTSKAHIWVCKEHVDFIDLSGGGIECLT